MTNETSNLKIHSYHTQVANMDIVDVFHIDLINKNTRTTVPGVYYYAYFSVYSSTGLKN